MNLDTETTNFVEKLDFDTLVVWAKLLEVECDVDMWLDDDYPDKDDELRVNVAEAMMKIGDKI